MSEWREVRLGEILEVLTDYHSNGSYKILKENVSLLDEKDFAVMIRTTNFEKNDFSENLKYITEQAYIFLGKSKVFPGDIRDCPEFCVSGLKSYQSRRPSHASQEKRTQPCRSAAR